MSVAKVVWISSNILAQFGGASLFYKLSIVRFAPTPARRTWRFASFHLSLANRKAITFNALAASPVAHRLLPRVPRFSLHALDAQQSDRPPGAGRFRGGRAVRPRPLGQPPRPSLFPRPPPPPTPTPLPHPHNH